MWILSRNTVAVLALAAAVGACGSGHDKQAAAAAAKVTRKTVTTPADTLSLAIAGSAGNNLLTTEIPMPVTHLSS